jgi:hypothetical protein
VKLRITKISSSTSTRRRRQYDSRHWNTRYKDEAILDTRRKDGETNYIQKDFEQIINHNLALFIMAIMVVKLFGEERNMIM